MEQNLWALRTNYLCPIYDLLLAQSIILLLYLCQRGKQTKFLIFQCLQNYEQRKLGGGKEGFLRLL